MSPDIERIRARFDAEMRKDPSVEPGERVERSDRIVRVVGSRAWIAYSDLTETEAGDRVRAEAAWARSTGTELEWKLYGHDGPPTLSELLRANGFAPDPSETLMVYDLTAGRPLPSVGGGVHVRRVEDAAGLEVAAAVSRSAFAPGPGWDLDDYLPHLGTPSFEAFLAEVDGRPVSAGRLELPAGRSFASLWGGGTAPGFRGRGVYRALVAARAELASTRGYRYLTVDARESSRPILDRLGFQPVTTIVGWVLAP
ncbi:MAG: GNAT family N-acetyltransferase [Thermoplasmata archaeon]|nr:GNAT family N-acetyltransferase [Thermoplasmata archaeon]